MFTGYSDIRKNYDTNVANYDTMTYVLFNGMYHSLIMLYEM